MSVTGERLVHIPPLPVVTPAACVPVCVCSSQTYNLYVLRCALGFLDMSYTARAQSPYLSFTVSHPALPCGSPGHMGVGVLAIENELYCWVVLVHTFNPRI